MWEVLNRNVQIRRNDTPTYGDADLRDLLGSELFLRRALVRFNHANPHAAVGRIGVLEAAQAACFEAGIGFLVGLISFQHQRCGFIDFFFGRPGAGIGVGPAAIRCLVFAEREGGGRTARSRPGR